MMKKIIGSLMKCGVSIFSSNKHQQHTLKPFEKEALQDLKKILESSDKNKQVSMWGIPLTTTSSETTTQDKGDVILLKFLRAREFDVPESYVMLCRCLAWRKDFGADSIVEEELGFKELENGSSGYMMNGFDRQGQPFLYVNNSVFKNKEFRNKFLGDDIKVKKFVRWHVQVLERMIKMLDFNPNPEGINSITRVFDGKDYYYSVLFRAPELKVVSKHILNILCDNYPGMVSPLISINCPWQLFFYNRILISVLSRYVPQISFNIPKFIQATGGNTVETLFKYIRPEYIPIQYGGLSRPSEFSYIPTKRTFELTVEGGETVNIPIEGIEAGAIITWDMVVRGWDLEYSVKFVPEAAESNAIVVEMPRKMLATYLAVHNYFISKEAGKLVLFIDNTTSRERKVVFYRYLVQQYQAKLA